jgi:tricarboxylate carrier
LRTLYPITSTFFEILTPSQSIPPLSYQARIISIMFKQTLFKSTQSVRTHVTNRLKSAVPLEQHAAATAAPSTASSSVPIGKSLFAAAAGIGSVALAATLVESSTASSVPAFDPLTQRYSQETFGGRFARMLLACDPKLLMYSEAEVSDCQAFVQDYKSQPQEMDRALWEAKRIYESAIHPDTGDIIPRPFRMSGYVPCNGPVCVAIVASQSTMPLLFWAWVNQSQNALVNFYNRNASSPMTNKTLLISYGAAVGSALVVAFGLATGIQRRYSPEKAKALLQWVAFPSAIVASSLNCYIVRSPELVTGIPLMNNRGEVVANGEGSMEAARRGVNSTTISRAILQAPVYFLPPVLMASSGILKKMVAKNPTMAVPLTTYLLLVSFGIGLPATVAIFPQISELSVNDAEPKFQHLRDPQTNQPYETFYYNKGL